MRRVHGYKALLGAIGLTLALLGAGAAAAQRPTTASSWSHEMELARWLDAQLAPYLDEVFVRHPRFKGQSLRLVAIHEGRAVAPRNELTRSIIRRLDDTLRSTPGLRLWSAPADAGEAGCRVQAGPDYDIGVEIVRVSRAEHRLAVRALDVAERHWVSGFGRQWQGRLLPGERRMLAARLDVPATPGTRALPFSEQQVDLLARLLAQDLHNDLCARPSGVVTVHLSVNEQASSITARVRRLVRHNLSALRDVTVVDDPAAAQLHLQTHIEVINGDLHQVWISAVPDAGELVRSDIGAQAYLTAHRRSVPVAPALRGAQEPTSQVASPSALVSVAVLTPAMTSDCASTDPWRHGETIVRPDGRVPVKSCYALDIHAQDDIKFFVLSYDPHLGLQRMVPSNCRRYGRARSVLARGERLQFPASDSARRQVLRAPSFADTRQIYVLAATDHKAGAMLEAKVAGWRDACSRRAGTGRDATASSRRLDELKALVKKLGGRARMERLDIVSVGAQASLATAATRRGQYDE